MTREIKISLIECGAWLARQSEHDVRGPMLDGASAHFAPDVHSGEGLTRWKDDARRPLFDLLETIDAIERNGIESFDWTGFRFCFGGGSFRAWLERGVQVDAVGIDAAVPAFLGAGFHALDARYYGSGLAALPEWRSLGPLPSERSMFDVPDRIAPALAALVTLGYAERVAGGYRWCESIAPVLAENSWLDPDRPF